MQKYLLSPKAELYQGQINTAWKWCGQFRGVILQAMLTALYLLQEEMIIVNNICIGHDELILQAELGSLTQVGH